MSANSRAMPSNLDVVILEHIQEAEDIHLPTPPSFVDTLVRLSQVGFISSDSGGELKVTKRGRKFLSEISHASV